MASLEIKLLAGLSLRQNGLPLSQLKTQKGLALLGYLAVTGRPASRAALAGLFWPDKPEADAHMNLRKVLVRLRSLSPYLSITRASLAFNPDVPHTLDVSEFEANVSVKTDIARLQAAVELYQGDFLAGFELDDAPFFDDWMLAQRARLRALALGALEILIGHFAAQAAYDTAIGYARRVLALEPWHEETHRALMRLLAVSGQRSAALAQYELCRGLLASELGADPAPATIELHEQIRSGSLAGAGLGPAGLGPAGLAPAPVNNLPADSTAFIGRERELKALADHLADPNVRLLTILGLGGMGKTRLALAAAQAQLESRPPPLRFADGAIFIALARLETPDQVVPALAAAVNLRFASGSEPKAQLLDYLHHKRLLLVLDNFEHLRDQTGLIADILRAAPRTKILVTSRAKLSLQAEQLFPIGGLALPFQSGAPDEAAGPPLAAYGAIQLFLERARRVRPAFELTAENQAAVIEICRLVQGMPLGIVLATAWLETFSPREIADEIRAGLDFLASEIEDIPVRQRSLRAAFNHTWRLLAEPEQAVFQRLSIFRGGFTRRAAQAVTGASLRDLQGLVDKSLLAVSLEGRYDVHELLRQFATEKLAEAPDHGQAVRDRHSAYYCGLLAEETDRWHTGRQLETLATVTIEADNARRAWQWALECGEAARMLAAIDSWGWYHDWRGRLAEGEAAFRAIAERAAALAAATAPVPPTLLLLWASALTWQAWFDLNSFSALEMLRAALVLLERPELAQTDTRRSKAFVLKAMADSHNANDRHSARPLLEQSLVLYRDCDDQIGVAHALDCLAFLDWGTGRYAQAQVSAEASLALHRARGDLRDQTSALTNLAWVNMHLGRLEPAVRLRLEVVELSRQLGDRSLLVGAMADLAFTLLWQGKLSEMRQWAEHALTICLEVGNRGREAYVRLAIACTSFLTGRYEQARRETQQGLAIVRESGHQGIEATLLWALGSLALVEPDCGAARSIFAESRRLYEHVGDNYIGLTLAGLGYVECCEARLAAAGPQVVEALQFALALKDYMTLVVTLPVAALALSQAGAAARALEVWELAVGLPLIAHSQWHADVVGKPIAAASAALSVAENESARERGQALDPWETAAALVAELLPAAVLSDAQRVAAGR